MTVHLAILIINTIFLMVGGVNLVLALRAKERLRFLVSQAAVRDERLRRMKKLASDGKLSDVDVAELHGVLESLARELPENDRKYIEKSLNQHSKLGERSYIAEMFTA